MNNLTLLIDGPSLVYRAFFAIQREMTTSKGVPTKAVYGFSTMLGRLLADYNPVNVAVCFDRRGPTFRHEEYKDYKAGRPPMPDDLGRQFPLIKEILSAMNIAVIDAEGYEADDIIGTLAKKTSPVLIVTSDRDLLQLATEETKILITIKGVSQFKIFGKAEMLEEYGFYGESFIDYKALRGDPSDNIPGVRGIGEKTAIELIKKFGSIENLENNAEQIAKKSVRDKLVEDKISLHMSRKLATIFTDVPLDIKAGGIKRGVPNYAALEKIYRELEMNQFLRMMINEEEARRSDIPQSAPFENAPPVLSADTPPFAISDNILPPEPKGDVSPPAPFESAPPASSGSAPPAPSEGAPPAPSEGAPPASLEDASKGAEQKGEQQSFDTTAPPADVPASAPAPASPEADGVIGHNIKAMMVSGKIPLDAKIDFDTELAMYLLNPAASDYVPPVGGVTKEFCEGLRKELEEENLLDVFERVELPLIPILAKFETYGIKTDREILFSESSKLKKKIDSLAEEICADAGEVFNVNSPKQLAEILYGKLGLPILKKTKTGPSTKADVLEKLAEKNPIVKKILEHRQLAKLYGTYAEGLIRQIGVDGRIYAKWEQTRTATGRLSSKDPNMQNLPIREERGREIRKAFLPSDDSKIFVSADYSQIELRVLAHMSGDENLLEDFRIGADIHIRTAARILGISESEVTQQLRSRAKAVNFGIIYGMSAFGLSEGVGITPTEAESFIKDYFDIYQGVRTFMDSQVLQAKTTGVVRTILGRKRNVPEIYSKNYMLRKLGERLAQNSPIQGSAADIIKLAMIAVSTRLKKESLDGKALEILQLHDEIVIETDADIKEEVKAILKEEMESAIELKVPLIVSLGEGRSLYELK